MPPIVETRALTKRYGSLAALKDCDLKIEEGEICGLLGPNGAGKTTLLRLLMGYLRPSHGSATIFGRDCYRDSVDVHRHVTYLPGDARLFGSLTGHGTLAFFAGLRGAGYLHRACQLAERLDLDLSRRVANMSTGMRQKLALVVALSADAPVVILDEPTSNLDPTVRSDVLALVRESRQAGRTVLFSSHVLDEVERCCDRVVILRRGELVHEQPMNELRRQHRISARLIGELPSVPDHLVRELTLETAGERLTILTPDELSPLLGWLATLPLVEVRIEPLGLGAVYERFHAGKNSDR